MKPISRSAKRLVFIFTLALFSTHAMADQAITLHWFPRPPFHYVENGRITGLLVDPLREAFEAEGIAYKLVNTPATRLYNTIKDSSGYDCGLGWYKNSLRESFAKFSQAIYQDSAIVGVVKKAKGIPTNISAADLLSKWDIRVVAKQTFTHGTYLDRLLSTPRENLHVERTPAEVPTILEMINVGRADLTLMLPVEVDYVFAHGIRADDFEILHFPDVTAREYRYLMCSQKIPDALMRRINNAIVKHIHLATQP